MQTYTDNRLLFLTDAEFKSYEDTAVIPLIDQWDWHISGDGKGFLSSPDGEKHCVFDLAAGTLMFEPDGEPFEAPGLSASLVQEMGEQYAYDVAFSEEEKRAYENHILMREQTKREFNQKIHGQLKGLIQIEYTNGSKLAYVDVDGVKDISGIDSPHVISVKDASALFNKMSEALHASSIRDPSGYMALKGNVYECLRTEYQNQYEDMLQAIDNQFVDGTGYGIVSILDNLPSTIRKDTSAYLPKGQRYGDLRFVKATDERKDAIHNFVKCRVSKTLTYEKKRSYEQSSLDKTHQKFIDAGNRFRESLSGAFYKQQAPDIPSI